MSGGGRGLCGAMSLTHLQVAEASFTLTSRSGSLAESRETNYG